MTTAGERLALWRSELGLTQAAMSMQIGIQIGQYKKYEQGRTVPGGDVLAAVATTGVNLNWLLSGEGPMRAVTGSSDQSLPEAANTATAIPAGLAPFDRRIEALLGILDGIAPQEAAKLLDEFAARASDKKQMAELQRAVSNLTAKEDGKKSA